MNWTDVVRRSPSWILSRRVSSFQHFFELGGEESASPFLDQRAKQLSRNLALKAASLSACLLLVSCLLKWFVEDPWWPIPLSFVYLIVGTPSLIASAHDIFDRHDVNIDVLTSLAAFGALAVGKAIEGAMLLVLFALAGSLVDLVTLKAKNALCSMYEIAPTKAIVVMDGGVFRERAVDDVRVGEIIAVRSGELVPLDGVIVKGSSMVSLAHMTGESLPISLNIGQTVVSGARILEGSIEVQVALCSHDSTVARLISLITRAHSSKPKLSVAFDRWNRGYALGVICSTAGILFVLPALFGTPWLGDDGSIIRSVGFLITASPCALILAVPITYLSALGASVQRGAILKGSVVLDRISLCRIVAFDKTGTLTKGQMALQAVIPLSGAGTYSSDQAVAWAASLDRHAVHPLAHALAEACSERKISFVETEEIRVVAGQGVWGKISIHGQLTPMFVGSPETGLQFLDGEAARIVQTEREGGRVTAILVIDQKEGYLFSFQDTIRSESSRVVSDLHSLSKHVVMLTGDRAESAERVGRLLGIDDVRAGLLPEHKLDMVAHMAADGGLLMVGDGINDAPALARSTVGVSMGQLSSATAREASDVVLLNNDLNVLAWLFRKVGQTRTIVYQNLVLAICSILVGTVSSVQGILPLWMAVFLHEGSTLIVGLNALRLLRLR